METEYKGDKTYRVCPWCDNDEFRLFTTEDGSPCIDCTECSYSGNTGHTYPEK